MMSCQPSTLVHDQITLTIIRHLKVKAEVFLWSITGKQLENNY